MNGPAGRRRAVTAALTATVLVALAGLVLTGLEWSSLATSDAVGNVGAAADLRALARGIYPPLLAEQGLVMALRAQAARSPVPVVLEADQVGRYPQDAESTVYFCTLEALQNVAKHAKASAATVRLRRGPGVLGQRRRRRLRGRRRPARLRPAGHVGPAGRARRHPGRPLPARPGHHHHRPPARVCGGR